MNLKQTKTLLNNNIEKILTKLDIKYEVFGDNIYSICPIHESSDNPRAFSFSKKRGIWKCWTRECQDQYRNDVFGLIQGALSHQNGSDIGFGQVIQWIRDEFNISLSNVTTTKEPSSCEEDEMSFDRLISYMKDDITFPQPTDIAINSKLVFPSPYFLGRGFKKKTLIHFNIGDCLEKSSKFYERAIIPIHDDTGLNTIGYICRSTKEYKIPKFLIYPQGFDKRYHFYNLHRAMPHIKASNSVFIVEGQGDVWKMHEAGIYNVLGILGRTLSREQEKRLQQLPLTHIIILTDNDQAGRESKIHLQRQLGRFYRLTFPKLSHKDIGDMSIKQIQKNILSQIRI